MACLLQEDIERCSYRYNWMCDELRRCHDSIRLFRLQPLTRALKRIKALLKKIIVAYVQVKMLRNRIQTIDSRIQRRIKARSCAVTFQILNEFEVHKGVLKMYVIYTATNLYQVQVTLEKCQKRLMKVMRP
ncbi:hypothetical protein LSH36_736g01001 [Paralvinella palmiformis]|uniref:Uncharacterized protein n=1 Tax=Paralvinella palmiformis TaxID=53620 RepID=A0AAD9MTC9_9ANNE|nr:hypothetical protein LSH36_736g01001 [Paralvinella palmiformis]